LDLAGLGLAEAFDESFEVDEDSPEQLVFSAPYPAIVESSTIANVYGFHGLPRDPETGLIYARHRYYDPDLGRFVSTDPFGYADGPSPYQFALNNPANFSDPTGESVTLAVLGGMALSGLATVAISAVLEAGISESPWGDQTFDYGGKDIAIDFTIGAATFGMSNYFTAGRWGLKGVQLFAVHRGLETGGDVFAEYARDPNQTAGQLAFGAVLNFAAGEFGTAAGRHFTRLRKTGLPGLGGGGGAYRVKTGLRSGSSAGGGGSLSIQAGAKGREIPPGLEKVIGHLPSNARFGNPRSLNEMGRVHSTDPMRKA
ncbi:MAG: RHS repeat-associated core domain-containing protein, partial [bacterium]|nr:RHS repeat-associated core domain-containing protein [bacterium]